MGVIVEEFKKDKLQSFLNKLKDRPIYDNKAYQHCIKADALRMKRLFMESIKEYQNALIYDEKNPEAFKGLGISFKETGRLVDSINSLNEARKLSPFDKSIYYELACAYLLNNKPCPAVKALVRAIKLDRDFIEAQFKLAIAHEMLEEEEMAVMIYEKVIEQRPSYIAAYNNLGGLYIRLHMYEEAICTFRKILSINPEFVRAYLGIGVAFDNLNRFCDAMRNYKKYLEQKPASANAVYLRDRIRIIKNNRGPLSKSHLKLIVG